jgi:hypothetical protein
MSITKYANFDEINNKTQNEGKYLQSEDLFIVSKNELDETDFGDCKYDVMEVSVYDINNNILPHKSGKNIAYIKTGDIKNYLYVLNNKQGFPEMAIDAEKLLNELGFTNGILKLNINFVRNKVGSDNELTKVWIQEISPSREEVRIIPLKTKDESINVITTYEFKNIHNLSKDFKYYKRNILDALDKFESDSLGKIDDALVAKFGNDFRATIRKDFGLRDLDTFNKRIFDNFRDSVNHWLNNRYYDISQSNFGKPSEIRFIDCEQYSFTTLMGDISNILNNCITYNIKTLKRRAIDYSNLPKEFAVVELRKQIQDNLNSFQTNVDIKRNVYAPDKVDLRVQGTTELAPIKTVTKIEVPVKVTPPPVIPIPIPKVFPPIEIAPEITIKLPIDSINIPVAPIVDFSGVNLNIGLNAMGLDNLSNIFLPTFTPIPIVDEPAVSITPSFGGGSSGGGIVNERNFGDRFTDRNDMELQVQ